MREPRGLNNPGRDAMPNTLGHLGVQLPLSRVAFGGIDARWLALGCLLPDVPWILLRGVDALAPAGLDRIDARLYATAQASLAVTLLLAAACAAISAAPRRVFAALGVNALAHLLLDACQIKWGTGVYLLAPFSWRPLRFELFWPESAATILITAAGLAVVMDELRRREPVRVPVVATRVRAAAAVALLVAYLGLPLAAVRPLAAHDATFATTLRDVASRTGKLLEVDRRPLERRAGATRLQLWNGEAVALRGRLPDGDAIVSLRGRFASPDQVVVDDLHVHRFPRDLASYVGIAALVALWLAPRRSGGDALG